MRGYDGGVVLQPKQRLELEACDGESTLHPKGDVQVTSRHRTGVQMNPGWQLIDVRGCSGGVPKASEATKLIRPNTTNVELEDYQPLVCDHRLRS